MNTQERQKLYTLRWYINNTWGQSATKEDVLDILADLFGENVAEAREGTALEGGQQLKWYPLAQTTFANARTRGGYARGYPQGAVVHFTAGRRNGLHNGIDVQTNTRMCYFVIDEDGQVAQNFPLDEWGYHAGMSSWPSLPGTVSNELVGIEVMCGGKLSQHGSSWKTWYGETVPASDQRTVTERGNMVAGTYQKYTQKQENALIHLIIWLHRNHPSVFSLDLVLGHDEVSPSRKTDPGGSLSMTMSEFREKLKSL